MTTLSILDLAPITLGSGPREALLNSRDLAAHADAWGYHRYWLAEHHNMPGIASSATAVAIGFVAGQTQRIRLGAGGVMLPNHAPLIIAEQYGTLEAVYPGRIDLGLGRAPGTDGMTAQALRRNLHANPDAYPQDVIELMGYLREGATGAVRAIPGAGSNVPIWILGSSLYGAQLAAALSLPYAFASHFAPGDMEAALRTYRENFRPSEHPQGLQAPYVMLGFNVCVAEDEAQARYLRSSALQAVVNLRKGNPGPLPPPLEDFEEGLSPQDRRMIDHFTLCSAVGDIHQVNAGIDEFVARTQADELMLVGQIFEHQARLESFRAIAASRLTETSEKQNIN